MIKTAPQISRLDDTEILLKSSFRTMAVFEFFADARRPASINEIATALKMPQSSTSSLIASLVDTGYLTRIAETRTYTPSMRLNYLNAWRNQHAPIAANFSNHMKTLYEKTGETTVLAMRNGIYSQYILVHHSHDILREHVETGSVRPLVCSATGWSLISADKDREIKKLINRTRQTIKNPRWLETTFETLDRVDRVRQNGYAFSDGEAANGASGLAIAVPSKSSIQNLAIGIAGPTLRINKNKQAILEILRQFVDGLPKNFTQQVLGLPS